MIVIKVGNTDIYTYKYSKWNFCRDKCLVEYSTGKEKEFIECSNHTGLVSLISIISKFIELKSIIIVYVYIANSSTTNVRGIDWRLDKYIHENGITANSISWDNAYNYPELKFYRNKASGEVKVGLSKIIEKEEDRLNILFQIMKKEFYQLG